jgi:hypothetical protein
MIEPTPVHSYDTKSSSIKIMTAPKLTENSEIHIRKEKVEEKRFETLKPSDSSKDSSVRNESENVPYQSSKTIRRSLKDESGTLTYDLHLQEKPRLKRNTTKKYIMSLTAEEVVYNTLWGFLIKFIRENGPQLFRELEKLIYSEYKNIRKLSGHMYTGNVHKAVKGALTANGLFTQVAPVDEKEQSQSNCSPTKNSINPNAYWTVVEEVAQRLIDEKVEQVLKQQNKQPNKPQDPELKSHNNSTIHLEKFKTMFSHLDKLEPEADIESDNFLASLDD